LNKFN